MTYAWAISADTIEMAQVQETQHALLIPWGQFAQEIGLIAAIEAVKLKQKTYEHTPQTKVLEFLVAILSGGMHPQDISRAAHPLDQDTAVAKKPGSRQNGQVTRVAAEPWHISAGMKHGNWSPRWNRLASYCWNEN
jgi:hypothetical protein